MNKLQRYWAEESGIYSKDADVAPLEAENERLRAWIEFLLWGAVGIASQGSRTK